ncbi:carbohydrate-binding module family 1 [Micractinium conductrix]|uniref:Carbohydrate-binding module family 1 n=1 Tax=Micractinium conductrix TaxID=554055 RepID=A0A2P6VCT6_9CHLO|nr:carbohydrate-binding module family 1 [Micractinium conductrix]PSC71989.1 carbohydrate-binding module family 1 [Micractinium conductrix]|eukprot:PSC71898.1 carbohydrate-binding module family 1 [Micractinium conductrix]
MLARPEHTNWTKALASWTCPTNPSNSVGGACDPCGQQVWGNWEHVSCRGARVAYDKYVVPGDGTVTNVHVTGGLLYRRPVPLAELCPLKSLREFDVDDCSLTGTIPTGFYTCFPDLIEIDLSYNKLTGTLPKEIALNEQLEEFKVEHNALTGTIPSEYGGMNSLNWLRFSDNGFSGRLPESFAGTAPHLYQLMLDDNGGGAAGGFEGDLYTLAARPLGDQF